MTFADESRFAMCKPWCKSADMENNNISRQVAESIFRRVNWASKALLAIAAVFLLRTAQPILVPVALAIVLAFALATPVRRLKARGVPHHMAAALVLIALLGSVSLTGVVLASPAVDWWQGSSGNVHQLAGIFERMRNALPMLASARSADKRMTDPLKDKLASESVAFTGIILSQFGRMLLAAAATLILAYLLLISEPWLISYLLAAFSGWRQRALVLSGLREVQREIGYFLATMSLINIGLGIAVGVAMAIIGLPHAVLWAAIACALNFIPYFGPLTTSVLLALSGVSHFDSLGNMLAPLGLFLLINALESNLISPWAMGRRLQLSPLAIFFSVLVWGWMWGIAGAFLAVPMLICIRSILRRRGNRLLYALLEGSSKSAPSLSTLMKKSSGTSTVRKE